MGSMLTPRHKIVALAHVSNVLGSVLDVRRAADMAHSVGAKILLDGCQAVPRLAVDVQALGSEEHTSELQSLMRISYAVLCLKKKQCVASMQPATQPWTYY